MDFSFDAEQKSLAETVGRVLADFPALAHPDATGESHSAVWTALAGIGLFALLVPEAEGGMGLGLVDLALVVERLGAALASPLIAQTLIATDLISRFGSSAQKQALLPAIAAGSVRIALATEDGADRGPRSRRILVPEAAAADWFVAACAPRRQGEKPALALLQRSAPGVVVREHDSLDPASRYGAVGFDDQSDDAREFLAMEQHDTAPHRLAMVAPCLYAGLQCGIADRVLTATIAYAKTRVQFGRPIGSFQTIKHRCADLAVALDAARTAAYYAFWAVASEAADATRASSMAKAYCGEVTRMICNEAVQIHGGMGFTWELGLHRFLRHAKMLDFSFGNPDFHYERVLTETIAAANRSDPR